jgi:uncharacterized protein (TIGR03435 family)
MEMFAGVLPMLGNPDIVSLPVVDHTRLSGRFDLTIEFVPQRGPSTPTGENVEPASDGSTILEALKEQPGLKLEPAKGPRRVPVIDHVERPSEN